jgi:preprotein translocase subunit SecA
MFERMLGQIREDVTRTLAFAQFRMESAPALPDLPDFLTTHIDPLTGEDDSYDYDGGSAGLVTTRLPQMGIPQPTGEELGTDPAQWEGLVSRNAPCPCGSGRKYKHCHGQVA